LGTIDMNSAPRHSYVEGNDAKIETTASGDNHLRFAPVSLGQQSV